MRYVGMVNGHPGTLEATRDGFAWSGTIDVGGYRYQLAGQLDGEQVAGVLLDTVTSNQMPMSGSVTDDVVRIDAPVQLTFTRAGDAGDGRGGESRDAASAGTDPQLVGVWLWSDAMVSGGYSVAAQQRTELNDDGTFTQFDAQTAGLGLERMPGTGGALSAGWWRADGTTLSLSDGGPFVPTARYQTDGASLLLTFADGSRQLWQRLQ